VNEASTRREYLTGLSVRCIQWLVLTAAKIRGQGFNSRWQLIDSTPCEISTGFCQENQVETKHLLVDRESYVDLCKNVLAVSPCSWYSNDVIIIPTLAFTHKF